MQALSIIDPSLLQPVAVGELIAIRPNAKGVGSVFCVAIGQNSAPLSEIAKAIPQIVAKAAGEEAFSLSERVNLANRIDVLNGEIEGVNSKIVDSAWVTCFHIILCVLTLGIFSLRDALKLPTTEILLTDLFPNGENSLRAHAQQFDWTSLIKPGYVVTKRDKELFSILGETPDTILLEEMSKAIRERGSAATEDNENYTFLLKSCQDFAAGMVLNVGDFMVSIIAEKARNTGPGRLNRGIEIANLTQIIDDLKTLLKYSPSVKVEISSEGAKATINLTSGGIEGEFLYPLQFGTAPQITLRNSQKKTTPISMAIGNMSMRAILDSIAVLGARPELPDSYSNSFLGSVLQSK